MTPVRILTVCTGNVCRSPAAEYLLAAAFAGEPGVGVHSAGTGAPVGHPVSEVVGTLLLERGIDASGHRARALTVPLIRESDLILTATRRHRSQVVALDPAALRRTFTLREFARLAEAARLAGATAGADITGSAARLDALVGAAFVRRGGADIGDDDIADPYGRDRAFNEAVIGQIDAAVTRIRTLAHT